MNEKIVYNLNEIDKISKIILDNIKHINIVLLKGDLGSGKTTLVKSILKKLGVNDEIKSPTFSIVNEYDHPSGPIYHFDLYRIEKIDELDVIGFEEYIDNCNICFIEWPEVGMEKIFGNYMQINLGHIDDNKREILITKK